MPGRNSNPKDERREGGFDAGRLTPTFASDWSLDNENVDDDRNE